MFLIKAECAMSHQILSFSRCPLSAMALALILPVLAVGSESRLRAERPNIILAMADDQGWGDVAYNGHPVLKTPVLDEIAASGLRFDRFYASSPVCSPTRGSR